MNDSPVRLAELLRRHGLHLKKGLGQNFLADPVHLERIVAAAELTPDDVVVEVGPGVGTLTARLASQAGRVVAVELDVSLLPALHETLAAYDNVTIVQGDILQLDPAELSSRAPTPAADATSGPLTIDRSPLPITHYKVVANLPYYITSAAIRHLLTAERPPALLVLTVQREVAQRIVARPPDMSLLAVSVQFYAQPEIVARIPAGAFYPPPKVDSAILRLRPWPRPPVDVPDVGAFFAVARAGFGQRRKQLRNSLCANLALPQEQIEAMLSTAGIDAQRRAETLTLGEWAQLAWARRDIARA
ncbi:MAG TPA: 16S rRNA (adenine(1518)-N(6)/adenine(1519)-N(6))-dimethyltransferase RsmA [Anaerolineae bacterium]|nr:16S rRNA (adenine(1518)-N(6)/adenine(1519)-N(6))-dimethyltransferase RsmA [Anaerolineae bacterium]